MMKKVLILLTVLLAFNVIDVSAATLEERQEAVIETAYSYYLRGKQIQYDGGSLTRANVKEFGYDVGGTRNSYDLSPEEATSQETLFFVCSSFAYNVYKEAINYSLFADPRDCVTINMVNLKGDIVVDSATITDSMDIESQKEKIRNLIEPGDIIVYYQDTKKAGHAMLYIGDDNILHSTGSHYDFTNKKEKIEPNGTIVLTTLTERLNYMLNTTYSNRYVILRPLKVADDETYPITDNAKKRMQYKRLYIEKTANITEQQGINIGEELTFTITLRNNSNEAYTVNYQDKIPENTTYIDNSLIGATINNNSIEGNISLNPSEEKKITYRVRVNNDTNLYGKKIVSDSTYVAGLKAKVLEIPIDTNLNTAQVDLLRSSYNQYKNKASSIYELINIMYSESLGINLDINNASEVFNAIFDSSINSYDTKVFYRKKDISNLSSKEQLFNKINMTNMYAGIVTVVEYNSDVIKEIRTDYLLDGDIILSSDGSKDNVYLFLDQKLITIENGQLVEISDNNSINSVIQSLIGEHIYTVLRPSKYLVEMNNDIPVDSNDNNITEETPNTFDIVAYYAFFGGCAIFGIISGIVYFKRKKLNS